MVGYITVIITISALLVLGKVIQFNSFSMGRCSDVAGAVFICTVHQTTTMSQPHPFLHVSIMSRYGTGNESQTVNLLKEFGRFIVTAMAILTEISSFHWFRFDSNSTSMIGHVKGNVRYICLIACLPVYSSLSHCQSV